MTCVMDKLCINTAAAVRIKSKKKINFDLISTLMNRKSCIEKGE